MRVASFESELRGAFRAPRVLMEIRSGDRAGQGFAKSAERVHIESQMARPVRLQIGEGEPKKANCWMQPAPIFRMFGTGGLFLEMDERAGDLDQPFEEGVVGIALAQPEVFKHIVRFVITLGVEAGEITSVTGIQRAIGLRRESADEGGNAVAFFHLAGLQRRIILRSVVRDKMRSNPGVSARLGAL